MGSYFIKSIEAPIKRERKINHSKIGSFSTDLEMLSQKDVLVFTFFLIFLHIGADAICIFCSLLKCSQSLGTVLAKYILYFDCSWLIILAQLFWTPGRETSYDLWITKKEE